MPQHKNMQLEYSGVMYGQVNFMQLCLLPGDVMEVKHGCNVVNLCHPTIMPFGKAAEEKGCLVYNCHAYLLLYPDCHLQVGLGPSKNSALETR